eukprot:m.167876 g.167876  ORF g.167876 m.167876 type:complete len:359 (-) comp53183_c0_seq2:103-1179(-)
MSALADASIDCSLFFCTPDCGVGKMHVRQGAVTHQLTQIQGQRLSCVAVNAKLGQAVVAADGLLHLLALDDITEQRVLERTHKGIITCMLVRHSANRLVVCYGEGFICLYDMNTWALLKKHQVHTSPINHVQESLSGSYLLSVSWTGGCRVSNAETLEWVMDYRGHVGEVNCCAILPLAESMAATGGADRHVHFWTLHTGELVRSDRHHEILLSFSSRSQMIFSIVGSLLLRRWSWKVSGSLRWIDKMVASATQPLLAVCDKYYQVAVLHTETFETLWVSNAMGPIAMLLLVPHLENEVLLVGDSATRAGEPSSTLQIHDLLAGTLLCQLPVEGLLVGAAVVFEDLARFAHIKSAEES